MCYALLQNVKWFCKKRHPMQFVFSSEVILTQISSFCTSIEVIEIIKLWNYAKNLIFVFI